MRGIKMKTLTIVGCGFVGAAAYEAFCDIEGWDVSAYDKYPETCKLATDTKFDSVKFVDFTTAGKSDVIFVALPTPMDKETGQCRTELVETVVYGLRALRDDSEIIIKSTVPPGTTKRFNDDCGNVYFNPEFLTEADPYQDFVNLPYQIIGLPDATNPANLRALYRDAYKQKLCDDIPMVAGGKMILECDSTTAEMVKLTRNCYLATRLSFFNEIKQICDKLDVPYDDMKHLAGMDDRIGSHYSKIPGPDGKVAFGGSCLCKDINDLMYIARELGIDPKVMSGVWEKNLELRPERDWELLKGRAVL